MTRTIEELEAELRDVTVKAAYFGVPPSATDAERAAAKKYWHQEYRRLERKIEKARYQEYRDALFAKATA